jgi:hypothetical protein
MTNLEKIVDNKAMLTCEETKTTSKQEALDVMSYSSYPCQLWG